MATLGSDEFFMSAALALARRARGETHPNPMVGAVIVEDGEIVAEGFHARAGEAHAEPAALRALGRRPKPGATLFVTLEPCCTHGRTPPCTAAITAAGFSRVVIGATDPNPEHAGRAFAILRAAGISVTSGVLAAECADLNPIFNHAVVKREPLFALKIATTLDGRTATRAGESQWITGSESRAEVMRLRKLFPAVATGSGTVLADNPRLTSRIPAGESCGVRLVLDRRGRTAEKPDAAIFTDAFREKTIVVAGAELRAESEEKFSGLGVGVWKIEAGDGASFFAALKKRCFEAGLTGVLFEPGATLAGAMFGAGAVDYFYHFASPVIFADAEARGMADGPARPALADAIRLSDVRREFFGDDLLTRGFVGK